MKNILAAAVLLLMCQFAIPGTTFTTKEGTRVLVGSNEDASNANPYVWFQQADQVNHGLMAVFNNGWQQGMNDQGLYFAWNSLGVTKALSDDPFKQGPGSGSIAVPILYSCSTVQDVLAMYEMYNERGFYNNTDGEDPIAAAQIQWVDATGASVVCGFDHDQDGTTSDKYGYVLKSGPFQVSTNFNLLQYDLLRDDEDPDPGTLNWIGSWDRYKIATSLLQTWTNPGISTFTNILYQTKRDDTPNTLYSIIADLGTGDVYFYYHGDSWPSGDFGTVLKKNAYSEMQLASHGFYLSDGNLNYQPNGDVVTDPLPIPSPMFNALGVSINTTLQLTFTKEMEKVSGNVTVKEYDTDEVVEVIDIDDAVLSGSYKVVTISLSENLGYNTSYYVLMDAGCLQTKGSETPANAPYHGMLAKTSWRFKTVAQ